MIKTLTIKNVTIGEGRPKICVSVMGKDRESILREAKVALASKADVIEWRADYYEDIMDYNELRNTGKTLMEICENKPVIFTFRTIEEGGEKAITLAQYRSILNIVAENKLSDIIDIQVFLHDDIYVNDEIIQLIEDVKKCEVPILASNHNFLSTPTQVEIVARYMGMQKLGADITKIAVMPTSKFDAITMISATEEMICNYATVPLVSISMGKEGMASRIIGEFLGSAMSFAAVSKASAPGQINVKEMFIMLDKFHRAYGSYTGSELEEVVNNIFLVGFMGTGKTAVSKVLADIKGMTFIDLDEEVVKKEKREISKIFEEESEEYFRNLETEILKNTCEKRGQIVSCGGGIVLKDENIELMKENGIVVWLVADAQEILSRVQSDTSRPVLNGKMNVESINSIMDSREEQYKKAADYTINTKNMLIQDICTEILDIIHE